jgi:hypothetical protein
MEQQCIYTMREIAKYINTYSFLETNRSKAKNNKSNI